MSCGQNMTSLMMSWLMIDHFVFHPTMPVTAAKRAHEDTLSYQYQHFETPSPENGSWVSILACSWWNVMLVICTRWRFVWYFVDFLSVWNLKACAISLSYQPTTCSAPALWWCNNTEICRLFCTSFHLAFLDLIEHFLNIDINVLFFFFFSFFFFFPNNTPPSLFMIKLKNRSQHQINPCKTAAGFWLWGSFLTSHIQLASASLIAFVFSPKN